MKMKPLQTLTLILLMTQTATAQSSGYSDGRYTNNPSQSAINGQYANIYQDDIRYPYTGLAQPTGTYSFDATIANKTITTHDITITVSANYTINNKPLKLTFTTTANAQTHTMQRQDPRYSWWTIPTPNEFPTLTLTGTYNSQPLPTYIIPNTNPITASTSLRYDGPGYYTELSSRGFLLEPALSHPHHIFTPSEPITIPNTDQTITSVHIWEPLYQVFQNSDTTRDGRVDGADFLEWQRYNATSFEATQALTRWKRAFGTGQAPQTTVPEPSSVILLLVSFVPLLRWQKNAHSVKIS